MAVWMLNVAQHVSTFSDRSHLSTNILKPTSSSASIYSGERTSVTIDL